MLKGISDQTALHESTPDTQRTRRQKPEGIHVTLEFDIDLTLLRNQKRALIGVYEGATINYEQEEAAEGLLNLIDFIQDSVLEQGLAMEEEVFPKLPQLFEEEPKPHISI